MRFLIAPDKFKGSLTAVEAAEAMAAGVRDFDQKAAITIVPVADGGEGTHEAALAAGAREHLILVQGPGHTEVLAAWALLGGRAIIESAQASGLAHVEPTPSVAANASSYGTGQLILDALNAGVTEVIIGLGGSAMTDGGSGALRALGLRVLNATGHSIGYGGCALIEAASLDASSLDTRLRDVRIRLAVDVTNPLYGPEGAAHVFGEQKGADIEVRRDLDLALRHWAALLKVSTGRCVQTPGAGAAGGFPAAFLAFSEATIEPGFPLVAEMLQFEGMLATIDVVVTGEGSLDRQSLSGKAPIGVAGQARDRCIPAVAVAGRIELTPEQLRQRGIRASASVTEIAPSGDEGFIHAAVFVRQATRLALERLEAGKIGRV